MGETNKVVRGMMIGAISGAAISLLDRNTREKTIEQVRGCSRRVWHYTKNPSQFIESLSTKISVTTAKIEEVSDDIAYIFERVSEIKETSDKLLTTNQIGSGNNSK